MGVFHNFFNCTNGTKSRKATHLFVSIEYFVRMLNLVNANIERYYLLQVSSSLLKTLPLLPTKSKMLILSQKIKFLNMSFELTVLGRFKTAFPLQFSSVHVTGILIKYSYNSVKQFLVPGSKEGINNYSYMRKKTIC